ncbi:hypothetical protein BABINDRAFT_22547, partial [Babjeviella inositovora NRRL Y-12698]
DNESSDSDPSLSCVAPLSDSEDYSLDDFEDVEIPIEPTNFNPNTNLNEPAAPGAVNLTFKKPTREKPAKRTHVVPKEERMFRKRVHMMYVVAMVGYGYLRNQWCNSRELQAQLKPLINAEIMRKLYPDKTLISLMRSRKFLDALLQLARMWGSRFRVASNGIMRTDWGNLSERPPKTDANMTFTKFKHLVQSRRGSRDIGAQGFVALLRSVKLNARLVYSLQPPDFTNLKFIEKTKPEPNEVSRESKSSLLQRIRSGQSRPATALTILKSPCPIIWVEVWNLHAKHWVTVDPVVLQMIETVGVRSKLEPGPSDPANQVTYVVAFDRAGGVRDVTRRYSQQYNAKTRKKRITKTETGQEWYDSVLTAYCALKRRKSTQIDVFEQQEFAKRSLQEGMPNCVQDFRSHPVYSLETQLKSNEIIFPREPCGTLRLKGKRAGNHGDVVPVYKRANVHVVRSAKAWYMKGRLLRVGEQPLKEREKSNVARSRAKADDLAGEEEVGLYAEYQTELYVPPPVTSDGKVPKNSFGSIDVYTDTMVPEGGTLVSSKNAAVAARIMGIDYASATVGFEFAKRQVVAKTGGIVVASQFCEALQLIEEHLGLEEAEEEQKRMEMVALSRWRLILAKLRIVHRLNADHGDVTGGAHETEIVAGGFIPDEISAGNFIVDEALAGGFISKSNTEFLAGGFIPEDAESLTGGFSLDG